MSILEHVHNLLTAENVLAKQKRWKQLLTNANKDTDGLAVLVSKARKSRPHTRHFLKIGDVANESGSLEVSVRWRGIEVGTVELNSGSSRPFRLSNSAELEKLLVAAHVDRTKHQPVEFGDKTLTKLFKSFNDIPATQRPKEAEIEFSILNSFLGRRKPACFHQVQTVRLANLPFKLPVLIRCIQEGRGKTWQERLQVAHRYGYPDILARSEQADFNGKTEKRLGVFELKRPDGKAELALLQSYGYCCALNVMSEDVKEIVFQLCGYKKERKPAKEDTKWLHPFFQIRGFRAVAIIDETDEDKLRESKFTKAVQSEERVRNGTDLIGYITYTYRNDQLTWGSTKLWNTKSWVPC